MKCQNCGIEFEGRADAKTCSPRCRKESNRRVSVVTDNVTLSDIPVTDNFEFYIITKAREPIDGQEKEEDQKSKVRTTRYWYEIPLGAIPVMKKGWPEMPEYMNGRQYFLWWKNNFETQKGEPPFDGPILYNPFPKYENVKYVPMRSGMGV